jgi:hypothetical protein
MHSVTCLDLESSAEDDRKLIKRRSLCWLGPTRRTDHSSDTYRGSTGVHATKKLLNDLGWLTLSLNSSGRMNDTGHRSRISPLWWFAKLIPRVLISIARQERNIPIVLRRIASRQSPLTGLRQAGRLSSLKILRRGKPPHQSSVALCTSTSVVRIRLANHTLAQAVVCAQ